MALQKTALKSRVTPQSRFIIDNLRVGEAELICQLSLKSPGAIAYQAKLAEKLEIFYRFGSKKHNISPDEWIANKYHEIAYRNSPKILSKKLKTQDIYSGLGWYTSTRLFMVRGFNLFRKSYGVAHQIGKQFLQQLTRVTNIASLSYLIELLVDISVVFKTTFFPKPEMKKETPRWQDRFHNVLHKNGRLPRMRNAAVWFAINFACIFLTNGLYAGFLLAGFGFDVLNECYGRAKDYRLHTQTIRKITHKLGTPQANTLSSPGLNEIKQQLEDKFSTAKINATRAIIGTLVIFVGYSLILFPPAGLVLFPIVGAAMTLSISLLEGFGRRLWNKFMSSPATESVSTSPPMESKSTQTSTANINLLTSTPSMTDSTPPTELSRIVVEKNPASPVTPQKAQTSPLFFLRKEPSSEIKSSDSITPESDIRNYQSVKTPSLCFINTQTMAVSDTDTLTASI